MSGKAADGLVSVHPSSYLPPPVVFCCSLQPVFLPLTLIFCLRDCLLAQHTEVTTYPSTSAVVSCRYGVKMEAVGLLQEWVRDIGSHAGLSSATDNVRIFSGSIGVPESRLEVGSHLVSPCYAA